MRRPVWKTPDLAARLATDIAALPAEPRWRLEYAPELSYGRHAGPVRADTRLAAVAIVLCWNEGRWSLPLTVRGAALTHHGGQVSLPGGLVDRDETARDAAGRELVEELGVRPALEWLGELPPLFVFASNALVTPWVAAVEGWPRWDPQAPEVARVLRLELEQLVEQEATEPLTIQRGPLQFAAPQLIVEGESAWGATAVILGELRGRLRRIADAD